MRDGFFAWGGCLIGIVVAIAGCTAADANGDDVRTDDVTAPPQGSEAPPAPPSPLPPELQLPGGGSSSSSGGPAPSADPTLRTMWSIDSMNRLVGFTNKDASKPTVMAISGLAKDERVLGLDVRPADGQLYALGSTSRLYTIDRKTGAATAVGTKSFAPTLAGTAFGFNVNPVADKIRVHTDTDQNLRLDPIAGTATADPSLAFATGDVNQGQSPNLVASSYTNSVKPAPTATTLYAIDSTRNLLVKLANPNDGKVSTIGALGIDVGDTAGFDIWGKDATVEAYATLTTMETVAGKTTAKVGLYSVDLAKGTTKLLMPIAHPLALSGLAVEP